MADETPYFNMKVDIKELNPCRRLLQIEVGSEVVTERFKKVYKDFEKSARIPGFRPGKAPAHIVKLHYKEQIREEVLKRLIPDFYQQAMRENSLITCYFTNWDETHPNKRRGPCILPNHVIHPVCCLYCRLRMYPQITQISQIKN